MEIFRFNRALMRAPAPSVVDGLRAVDAGSPDFDGVVREHGAYRRALEDAGVAVDVLAPLEAFPDSIFVEDAALVFTAGAIALRPGAPSRRGEADEIAPALEARFDRVLRLEEGFADGGDVLTTPRGALIGLSSRTTKEGAATLIKLLAMLGLRGEAVTTPPGVLHFKSDCSLIGEETILATARLAASGVFKGFKTILVPEGEEGAANAVRINGDLLISDAYPRTAELLDRKRYGIVVLPTREIAKIDAGLSCLSLRWFA